MLIDNIQRDYLLYLEFNMAIYAGVHYSTLYHQACNIDLFSISEDEDELINSSVF